MRDKKLICFDVNYEKNFRALSHAIPMWRHSSSRDACRDTLALIKSIANTLIWNSIFWKIGVSVTVIDCGLFAGSRRGGTLDASFIQKNNNDVRVAEHYHSETIFLNNRHRDVTPSSENEHFNCVFFFCFSDASYTRAYRSGVSFRRGCNRTGIVLARVL